MIYDNSRVEANTRQLIGPKYSFVRVPGPKHVIFQSENPFHMIPIRIRDGWTPTLEGKPWDIGSTIHIHTDKPVKVSPALDILIVKTHEQQSTAEGATR